LKLVASARGDTAIIVASVNLKINGDTATNYSATYLQGNSSTAASGRTSSSTADGTMSEDGANATASTFGAMELYFPNYNSTGSKPFFDIDITEHNSASGGFSLINTGSHLYRGASGITSITLTPSSGNFVQYSNFYLYGIKNS